MIAAILFLKVDQGSLRSRFKTPVSRKVHSGKTMPDIERQTDRQTGIKRQTVRGEQTDFQTGSLR